MIPFKSNNRDWLLIGVPERSSGFSYDEYRNHISANAEIWRDGKYINERDWFSDTLPTGTYKIIGLTSKLTDEQKAEVSNDFKSLMESMNVYNVNPHEKPKPEMYMNEYENVRTAGHKLLPYMEDLHTWQQAQLRTNLLLIEKLK